MTQKLPPEDRKPHISVSLPQSLIDACRAAAKAEDRKLSNWVERALKEKLDALAALSSRA